MSGNPWEEHDRPFPGDLAGTIDPNEEWPMYGDDYDPAGLEAEEPSNAALELRDRIEELLFELEGKCGLDSGCIEYLVRLGAGLITSTGWREIVDECSSVEDKAALAKRWDLVRRTGPIRRHGEVAR